jgi:hypothetical protein
MAFWLAPGEKSGDNLAKNKTILSDHLLTKRVTIGYKNLPNVISYDVTFSLPIGEHHTEAAFESVTGYMPPEFDKFYQLHLTTGELEPLSTDGDEKLPVIFAVPGGTHAMGIYAPPQPRRSMIGPLYCRMRFPAEKVVKWNSAFFIKDKDGIPPGDYQFRMFVVVGDLETVRKSMIELYREAAVPDPSKPRD